MDYEIDWAAHRAMIAARISAGQPGVLLHVAQMVVGALARFPPPTIEASLAGVLGGVDELVAALLTRSAPAGTVASVAGGLNDQMHAMLAACELHDLSRPTSGAYRPPFPTTVFHAMRLAEPTGDARFDALLRALHACEPLVDQLVRSRGDGSEPSDVELVAALPPSATGKRSAAPPVDEAWAVIRGVLRAA